MGLTSSEVELVHLTGLVHDIGKIGVPAEVLQKTAALTDDEWAEMRRALRDRRRILGEVEDYARGGADRAAPTTSGSTAPGIRAAWRGDRIPLLARVIAVADAYNAMTSDRPYRRAMDPDVAITAAASTAAAGSSTRTLVEAFLKVLERESDAYRRGKGCPDFTLEAMQHPELTPRAPRLRHAAA